MDVDTHPNPQPNPHHRKIDLQSPHDLAYLQNNLAHSALQKLDLHFPKISKPATHISLGDVNPQPGSEEKERKGNEGEEEDPMRRRVHDLVTEFLSTTWRTASYNISVNGIDASSLNVPHTATLSSAPAPPSSSNNNDPATQPPQEIQEIEGLHFQYQPFNSTLQHKLASLHADLESLTAQVSKLRRTAPAQGAAIHQARLLAALEEDDARHEREMRDVLEEQEVEGMEIERVRGGWNEDVREVYERGVAELATLAGMERSQSQAGGGRASGGPTLTETVGKAQRARTVAMEME